MAKQNVIGAALGNTGFECNSVKTGKAAEEQYLDALHSRPDVAFINIANEVLVGPDFELSQILAMITIGSTSYRQRRKTDITDQRVP
jgi:hypothetical protein